MEDSYSTRRAVLRGREAHANRKRGSLQRMDARERVPSLNGLDDPNLGGMSVGPTDSLEPASCLLYSQGLQ